MRKQSQLLNKRFEKLLVVEKVGRDKWNAILWKCKCDCGNFTQLTTGQLNRGRTKSCGCGSQGKPTNLIGKKFGRLLVISKGGSNKYRNILWKCKCDCGNYKLVATDKLKNKTTKSCGCLKKESDNNRFGKNNGNWKGGVSLNDKQGRSDYRVKYWRQAVFKRDNYTCQYCGDKKGGNLEAHHKIMWCEYEYRRFDVDNGITLCEKCHKKEHKKIGYKNRKMIILRSDIKELNYGK